MWPVRFEGMQANSHCESHSQSTDASVDVDDCHPDGATATEGDILSHTSLPVEGCHQR